MTTFKQRGNLTECVQWTGFNKDEVEEFVKPRMSKDMQQHHVEFIETLFKHLVIVVNFGLTDAVVVGKSVIPRGTWLVDQGPRSDALGVVICEPERFKTLYEEVVDDQR